MQFKTQACPTCGTVKELTMNYEDYAAWISGELIQHAFPYLSIDDRERLITGYCGPCFDKIFEDEESEN